MNTAREAMLSAVRGALGRKEPSDPATVSAAYTDAVSGPNPRPTWPEARLTRFTERLEQAAATWDELAATAALPQAIARYLASTTPVSVCLAPDARLTGIEWPASWAIAEAPQRGETAPIGVSIGYAGIADTGSLIIPSAPERPTTLNFLPETHVVILAKTALVDYMETVWERLRAEYGDLPRTVNVITGPSRTADIEQTLQLGAHGPKNLHVLLLD